MISATSDREESLYLGQTREGQDVLVLVATASILAHHLLCSDLLQSGGLSNQIIKVPLSLR